MIVRETMFMKQPTFPASVDDVELEMERLAMERDAANEFSTWAIEVRVG